MNFAFKNCGEQNRHCRSAAVGSKWFTFFVFRGRYVKAQLPTVTYSECQVWWELLAHRIGQAWSHHWSIRFVCRLDHFQQRGSSKANGCSTTLPCRFEVKSACSPLETASSRSHPMVDPNSCLAAVSASTTAVGTTCLYE